uniref:Transposase Tc1-like domain-containing protein n=1 Tax=Lates calcarifer TaxID=8187 RepID=A0A4W6DTH1_LATCA
MHKRFNTVKNLSGRGRKYKVSPKLALIETLDRGGLHGRRTWKALLLRMRHVEAHLAFGRGHLKQDPSFWSTILWSDESKGLINLIVVNNYD